MKRYLSGIVLAAVLLGIHACSAQQKTQVKEFPTVPEFGHSLGVELGWVLWLGQKAGPQKPDYLGIKCGGCVKDAKPNMTRIDPLTPCTEPCAPADAQEIAALEAGIKVLQMAIDARKQGVPLPIELGDAPTG